ncbi:hypothetical protein BDV18DRAFT_160447 [Aspergillus unguis]
MDQQEPFSSDSIKKEEEALAQVNSFLLTELTTTINANPSRDLTEFLEHKLKTYPSLREILHLLQVLRKNPRDAYRIPSDAKVIRPLAAAVTEGVSPTQEADLIERLNAVIAESEILWKLGSTAILGLNARVVLKVGCDIDTDHISTLEYIQQQAEIPIPEIYGILKASRSRVFVFMARAAGEPLDRKWTLLDSDQKSSITEQLELIFKKLRYIPRPDDDESMVLGGGCPRRCKDARRELQTSQRPITNEEEFNEFISSHPRAQIPAISP